MVLTLLYFIKIKKYNIYIMRKTVEKVLMLVLVFFVVHNLYGWLVSREGLENKEQDCDKVNSSFQTMLFKTSGDVASLQDSIKSLNTQVTNLTTISNQALSIAKQNKEQIEKGKDKLRDSTQKMDSANKQLDKLTF